MPAGHGVFLSTACLFAKVLIKETHRLLPIKKDPLTEISGSKFVYNNRPCYSYFKPCTSFLFWLLATTHAVAAVQTFVAGTAAYGNMPAGVTGRCIALHALGCCIYRIHAIAVHPGCIGRFACSPAGLRRCVFIG